MTNRSAGLHLVAAHTVILKGVKLFQSNGLQEYSDLDIMQMMGRAVSPIALRALRMSSEVDRTSIPRRADLSSVRSMSLFLPVKLTARRYRQRRRRHYSVRE